MDTRVSNLLTYPFCFVFFFKEFVGCLWFVCFFSLLASKMVAFGVAKEGEDSLFFFLLYIKKTQTSFIRDNHG